jgi:hypothetical protein
MIKEGTIFPLSFRMKSRPYCEGWRMVVNFKSHGLDKRLRNDGWLFIPQGVQVSATSFGFGLQRTLRYAFQKTLRQNRELKFNCVEIVQANPMHLAGLAYVRIVGHARNVQQRA